MHRPRRGQRCIELCRRQSSALQKRHSPEPLVRPFRFDMNLLMQTLLFKSGLELFQNFSKGQDCKIICKQSLRFESVSGEAKRNPTAFPHSEVCTEIPQEVFAEIPQWSLSDVTIVSSKRPHSTIGFKRSCFRTPFNRSDGIAVEHNDNVFAGRA